MAEFDLEIVLKERVRPIVDEATEKYLGINIDKLSDDITTKLNKDSLIDIQVDTGLQYKEAKKRFKKAFLTKLLLLNLGNISAVARITGKNRRSIHRLVNQFNINIKKIKKELLKPYNIRLLTVHHIIEGVLDDYREIIHPDKLKLMYSNVSSLSENILRELPQPQITFADAIKSFERRYFKHALDENSNISKAAKKIGLRYETLYRKLKILNMI